MDPCEIGWLEDKLIGLVGVFVINLIVYLSTVIAVIFSLFLKLNR